MANPFVHVELNAVDPEKVRLFYSQLFQWELETIPIPVAPTGIYTLIKVGDAPVGLS